MYLELVTYASAILDERGVCMIKRDFYLHQIIQSMWDGQIKVITGLR